MVAEGLAAAGDGVCVWCPAGGWRSAGLSSRRRHCPSRAGGDSGRWTREVRGALLNPCRGAALGPGERVPHGYGYRSMNVWFCLWLCARALPARDEVTHLVVHEPFLAFGEGSRRQDLVAVVHRLMTVTAACIGEPRLDDDPEVGGVLGGPTHSAARVPFGRLPVPSTTAATATASETPPRPAPSMRRREFRGRPLWDLRSSHHGHARKSAAASALERRVGLRGASCRAAGARRCAKSCCA